MEPITFFYDNADVSLWQYDYGVRLQLPTLDHVTAGMPCQWHYGDVVGVDSRTITDDGGTLYVPVPDAALQQTEKFTGYIYVFDETSGRTRYTINVGIRERPSTDDTPSADNVTYIGQKAVEAAASASAAAASEIAAKASEDAAAETAAQIVTDEAARKTAETARAARDTAFQVYEAYDPLKAYVPLNKVTLDGSSYINVEACTGVAPTVDMTTPWLLIAKKGDAGGTWTALDQIPLVDAGNYFNGANPEAALQEVGANLAFFATNLVTNPDFSQGSTGWRTSSNATIISATGGVIDVNITVTTSAFGVLCTDIPSLEKTYVSAEFYTEVEATQVVLGLGSLNVTIPANTWTRASVVAEFENATRFYCNRPYKMRNPLVLKLKTIFGAGNEPTSAAEMDYLLANYPNSWFNGTVKVPFKWLYFARMKYLYSLIKAYHP